MTENEEIRRKLDMIDTQLCALLAKREELAGSDPVPDRRRLAAVRKVEERFGSKIAEAYKNIITRGLDAFAGTGTPSGIRHADRDQMYTAYGTREIFDITRELLGAEVYPGDPVPSMERVLSIPEGAACNLSRLAMGTHTGTHIDAPLHFIEGGKDIADVPPEKYIGKCLVANWESLIYGDVPEGCERLLIKGSRELSEEMAARAVELGIMLIGVEITSVGGTGVHNMLLSNDTVLLESIDLSEVPYGEYFLFCAPLKIAGADGAPCRAFLMTL